MINNIKISLFKPSLGDEELDAIKDVFSSGWLGMGPKTYEFEQELSKYIGVSNTVCLNSCTAALNLTLKLLKIGPGDEVIVPTITFIATAHAVIETGAMPIFCDVNKDNLLINFEDILRKITKRTKAIIVVHLTGRCVDVLKLKKITNFSIPIIEDCAHACGSELNGFRAGNLGDFGCFSFQAVKNLTTGDGGAVTTNNKEFAENLKKISWLGINQNTWDKLKNRIYIWDYDVDTIGLKFHMNDINASIGLVQLKNLTKNNLRRKEISDLYYELFKNFDAIELPEKDTVFSKSSWHIFCIKVKKRDELIKYLYENGISVGVHYKPIHLYKCYGNTPNLPISESVWKNIISLPIHLGLSNDDIKIVSDHIVNFYKR